MAFGQTIGIPLAGKSICQMNSRELFGLRIRGQWILGCTARYTRLERKPFGQVVKGMTFLSDHDFADLLNFRKAVGALAVNPQVEIVDFYSYQLRIGDGELILLENLGSTCLDQQLREYTGDGYSMIDFDEDGSILTHKKTGVRFKRPAPPLDRYETSTAAI